MQYQAVAQLNKKLNAPSDSAKTAGEAALQHTQGTNPLFFLFFFLVICFDLVSI
jgi:hypothetical protein